MRGDLRSEARKGSGGLPTAGKGIFASGEGISLLGEETLPVFYPKSTFPKRKGNPDGSSRGKRAVEGETTPQGVIRPLIN